MATGSLAVKCGKYYGVISTYIGDGKRKERKQKWVDLGITTKEGKKTAQRKLNEMLLTFEEDEKMKAATVLDVITNYMNDAKDRVAPTTYNNYRYIFDSHFKPYFSSLPKQDLDSITAKDINKYYNSLRKKGLSESTAAKHDQILTAAFNLAKRDGVITYNVMDGVKHPTEDYYEVNFYDIDQLNKLLQVAKDSPVYTEILLASFLGLRRGEVLGLKWDSVDFKHKQIKIHVNVTPTRNEAGTETVHISEKMKTKKSVRNLIMPESLALYLQNLKQQQENHKKEFGPYYDLSYDGFVCVDQFGKLHTPNYVSHSFKKVIRKNDLPDIRFHDLRHSCATMLLSLGFSMKAVQEQLGHTRFTTTANTYAHVYNKTKQEIAEKANEVLPIAM